MYLIDTNIWLELMLQQDKAREVSSFFRAVDASSLAITDFSLYSIGIILARLKKFDVFDDFVADTLEGDSVNRICLDLAGLRRISAMQEQFNLDFDDAYQYVAATDNELTLVSFDTDFDRTPLKRTTPAAIS